LYLEDPKCEWLKHKDLRYAVIENESI
jgi:hypothetical protein